MPRPMFVNKNEVLAEARALNLDDLAKELSCLKTESVPSADNGIAPVWETRRSLFHVSYSDDRGEFGSNEYTEWLCPVCKWLVGCHRYTKVSAKKKPCLFCGQCGQRIDWSDIDLDDNYEKVDCCESLSEREF